MRNRNSENEFHPMMEESRLKELLVSAIRQRDKSMQKELTKKMVKLYVSQGEYFKMADKPDPNLARRYLDRFRNENADFLKTNLDELKEKLVSVPWDEEKYTVDEILHHIIAHEIHHIGQLSVWARELERQPIPANFIGRELKSVHSY